MLTGRRCSGANTDSIITTGADPAFALLHCLWTQRQSPNPSAMLSSLVFALAFRATAAADIELRYVVRLRHYVRIRSSHSALAYECIAMFEELLQQSDIRGKALYEALLTLFRDSVPSSLYRIPRAMALFLAEASISFQDPAGPMYSPINKYLWRSPTLNLQDVPLLSMWMSMDRSMVQRTATHWIESALLTFTRNRRVRLPIRVEEAIAFLAACADNDLTKVDVSHRAQYLIKEFQ